MIRFCLSQKAFWQYIAWMLFSFLYWLLNIYADHDGTFFFVFSKHATLIHLFEKL